MSTVYILGAGFSRTCGIATDAEMLSELDPLLKLHSIKPWGKTTAIRSIREQMFRREREVGFEKFMTTLSSLKFMGDYLDNSENIFRESEKEVKSALKRYLESKVKSVNWANEGKSILRFISRVDWNADYVITFNYDLLLESAARHLEVDVKERILHLHGTISGRAIAWPTYTKFAYRTTKTSLGPLWKKAFQILRCQVENQTPINKLIFIGYSMPNTDLEAMSLFWLRRLVQRS